MRECWNWQTGQTKDLVVIAIVWVQVPSPAGLINGSFWLTEISVFLFREMWGYFVVNVMEILYNIDKFGLVCMNFRKL